VTCRQPCTSRCALYNGQVRPTWSLPFPVANIEQCATRDKGTSFVRRRSIACPHGQRTMSNRELKITTNLGNKTKKRQLREKRSRRARGLRALNLPTTAIGFLKTAENGSLSGDGHNSSLTAAIKGDLDEMLPLNCFATLSNPMAEFFLSSWFR